ncbi:MAG: hypothetical protein WDO17_11220 [Alphaproteobacteria bacterium]
MTDLLSASAQILSEAGFTVADVTVGGRKAIAFEDATVLGFVFAYSDINELMSSWSGDGDLAVANYRFGLRRVGQKAWNVYQVFLTGGSANHIASVALSAIEENLSGTRKIARAEVINVADVRDALLPLLRIQNTPRLEAVDIVSEIRQRTTELPPRAVDAFLSEADVLTVLQALEES